MSDSFFMSCVALYIFSKEESNGSFAEDKLRFTRNNNQIAINNQLLLKGMRSCLAGCLENISSQMDIKEFRNYVGEKLKYLDCSPFRYLMQIMKNPNTLKYLLMVFDRIDSSNGIKYALNHNNGSSYNSLMTLFEAICNEFADQDAMFDADEGNPNCVYIPENHEHDKIYIKIHNYNVLHERYVIEIRTSKFECLQIRRKGDKINVQITIPKKQIKPEYFAQIEPIYEEIRRYAQEEPLRRFGRDRIMAEDHELRLFRSIVWKNVEVPINNVYDLEKNFLSSIFTRNFHFELNELIRILNNLIVTIRFDQFMMINEDYKNCNYKTYKRVFTEKTSSLCVSHLNREMFYQLRERHRFDNDKLRYYSNDGEFGVTIIKSEVDDNISTSIVLKPLFDGHPHIQLRISVANDADKIVKLILFYDEHENIRGKLIIYDIEEVLNEKTLNMFE